MNIGVRVATFAAVQAVALLSTATPLGHQTRASFEYNGSYVEGCSCASPCVCELTGAERGCQGVGAFSIDSGKYNGQSLDGVRTAYAAAPGEWVTIYVDAPTDEKRAAGEAFMRAALNGFGPVAFVKPAKIVIAGSAGSYDAMVDGGSIMELKTVPLMGGDGKRAISISNIHDMVHPTVMMGQTTSAKYMDGDKSFTLEKSNAYYNSNLHSHGDM